jgi:hypothetical protein
VRDAVGEELSKDSSALVFVPPRLGSFGIENTQNITGWALPAARLLLFVKRLISFTRPVKLRSVCPGACFPGTVPCGPGILREGTSQEKWATSSDGKSSRKFQSLPGVLLSVIYSTFPWCVRRQLPLTNTALCKVKVQTLTDG